MQFCVDKQRMHKFHLGFWHPLQHKEKSTWHFYQSGIAFFPQILILTELFLYDISIIDNKNMDCVCNIYNIYNIYKGVRERKVYFIKQFNLMSTFKYLSIFLQNFTDLRKILHHKQSNTKPSPCSLASSYQNNNRSCLFHIFLNTSNHTYISPVCSMIECSLISKVIF